MMKKQGIPNTSELDDDQIEALIRKLSAIKGSAPELLAALKDEASSRLASRGGSRASTAPRGGGGGGGGRATAPAPGREGRGGPIRAVDYEDEYGDDYEEETESEEDDEFDEDGPCVGYGYSDEASVISEMTTPTVVSNLNVPDEERYNEIHQGYGAASRNKKPDLLSQVNRVNAARSKQPPAPPQRNTNSNSNSDYIDPMKRKAYTSGLSAMAKINEGEPAAVSKPQRKQPAAAPPAAPTKGTSSRRAPQPPQRKNSQDGATMKTRTGRGLKKKSSSADSGDEVVGSKSPKVRTKKSSSSHNKSKSSSSAGSGSGSKGSGEKRTTSKGGGNNASKSFADDWHKSLSGGDFDEGNMDDNGFPFSFGDEADNAFGASKSSGGWGNTGGAPPRGDAFDPFDANGFDNAAASAFQGKAPLKKPSSGSGGGRSKPSGGSSSRPKRDTSPSAPKRKPAIR